MATRKIPAKTLIHCITRKIFLKGIDISEFPSAKICTIVGTIKRLGSSKTLAEMASYKSVISILCSVKKKLFGVLPSKPVLR